LKQGYHKQLNRIVCELFAGDYHASNDESLVLSTLLGSCISVCLLDKQNKIAGMNHFMLPGVIRGGSILLNDDARYGVHSMELLINNMMKLGAKRNNLRAKVFGGGKVLGTTITAVSDSNIEFAINYLKMEEIPILSQDVGGNVGRKIYFYPDSFDIFVKKISYNKSLEDAVAREKRFLQFMQKQKNKEAKATNLTLFD